MTIIKTFYIQVIGIAIFCGLCLPVFAQSDVLHLQDLPMEQHEFKTYSRALVAQGIEVFKEGDRQLTFEEVQQGAWAWQEHDQDSVPGRDDVYWAHFEIYSDTTDTVLLEFGNEQYYTWSDINYYIVHGDSVIADGVSGNGYRPRDKPIRSAVNLAQFPVAPGINHFYCRLQGLELIGDDPNWVSMFHHVKGKITFMIHDQSTYGAPDAFSFPGKYAWSGRGHFFGSNYFRKGIELIVNPPADMDVDAIDQQWDDRAVFHYNTFLHTDSLYWMKFKVIGTVDGPGNYLFGTCTGSLWNFDSVEVYTRARGGTWDYQLTGNAIDADDRTIDASWNLFRVNVPPRDTQVVYLKLSGAGKRYVPVASITQFDEDTFWSGLLTIYWIYGGFITLIVSVSIFFIILGFVEKRNSQFWFAGMVTGFGLFLVFTGGDVNYFIFSEYEEWHPWLAACGGGLVVLGIYNFLYDYLELDRIFGLKVQYLLYPLIVIHLLICFYFGWSQYSSAGVVPVYENYYRLFVGSIMFNLFVALILAIYYMILGNEYAKFFVIAFGSLIGVIIVRFVIALSSFTREVGYDHEVVSTGIYLQYLLFLGVCVMIVFLAFGNGYRNNRIRKAAADAALRSREKELANAYLLQTNETIKKKSDANELLVKEIHHRVKNNLQILASMLSLQSDFESDEAAYSSLMETKSRIEAMGMIHQLLYLGDSGRSSIDMAEYLDELCEFYEDSFISEDQNVSISNEVLVNHLDIDTAVPIGLTITELVTNAKKHTFGNEHSGSIKIKLWINKEDQLCLEVSDDGEGNAMLIADEETHSFGTKLIQILSRKLRGTIDINNEQGYRTTIVYDRYTHYPNPV